MTLTAWPESKRKSSEPHEFAGIAIFLYTYFFTSNTFISNTRLKFPKNQAKAKQTLRLNFYYLEIIGFLHPRYHPKVIENI